jgi:hypothetical protein
MLLPVAADGSLAVNETPEPEERKAKGGNAEKKGGKAKKKGAKRVSAEKSRAAERGRGIGGKSASGKKQENGEEPEPRAAHPGGCNKFLQKKDLLILTPL